MSKSLICLIVITELMISIMFILMCYSFTRINQISNQVSNELGIIKSQNDSIKQEIILLNNYLYD